MRRIYQHLQIPTLSAAGLFILSFGAVNLGATALIVPDSGILDIANQVGSLVGVTTSPPCINWIGGTTCAGATHPMTVSGTSAIFAVGSGTIKDVSGTGAVALFETVTGAGPEAGNTINFDLTSIPTNGPTSIGTCGSNAPLSTCSPANSPFTLKEDITGSQVLIQFTTLLNAYTGSSATGFTPYRGIFTTQESGTLTGSGACNGLAANIVNILTCEAAGGTITATWSATESPSAVPEPSGLYLLLSGLLGVISLGSRRYRHRD